MVQTVARRLAPARPASFGDPTAGAVMGDPLSLPEAEIEPCSAEPSYESEPEPLWLKLPPELAQFFDLGFCHSEPDCPTVVFKAWDPDSRSSVEISGPPVAFLELADVIAGLCKSVPCVSHDSRTEAAQREAR